MSSVPPSQQDILQTAGRTSIDTFISALVFNSAIAVLFYVAFWFLRRRFPFVYLPRTFLVPQRFRSVDLIGVELLKACIWFSEEHIIERCGQDAFAVLFYLRTCFKCFGSLVGIAIITLFPLHASGGQHLVGLNSLTLANIAPHEMTRLWAHLCVSWIFCLACMYVIHKLLAKGAELRHSFLLSEEQRRSVSGYTLLLRDIPTPLRDPSKLFVLFDRIQPGCVHSVVVLKKSRTLDHYARKRLKARNALEHEITKYLQNLVHNSSGNRRRGSVTPESDPTDQMERGEKRQKPKECTNERSLNMYPVISDEPPLAVKVKTKSAPSDSEPNVIKTQELDPMELSVQERREIFARGVDPSAIYAERTSVVPPHPLPPPPPPPPPKHSNNNSSVVLDASYPSATMHPDQSAPSEGKVNSPSAPTSLPPASRRPAHRSMYIMGHKSDAIAALRKYSKKLEEKRLKLASIPHPQRTQGAAFVVFTDIFCPHVSQAANIDNRPGVMAERYAAVDPDDIIWENLDIPYYQRRGRMLLATIATLFLCIAWASITTFLTTIATLDRLIQYAPFLNFFTKFSPVVRGVIQGVVPTVAVTLVFQLIPIIMRRLSLFAGHPTKSGIEGRLLIFYYVFLVFNILLVVTISGSLFTAIRNMLEYPQRILSILATSIPTVSSFFVNYVMLLALSGPSGEMLQLGTLIIKPLRLRFFGTTPRLVKKFSQGPIFHTGTALAQHSFIATVGLTYCTVAPLVLIFVVLYFGLYSIAYAYQMQYVYGHLSQTGGMYLHTAARQLFVGIYIHQMTLIGLFLLKKAFIQSSIMLVALAATVIFHCHANLYKPLMSAVPAKVAVKMERERADNLANAEAGNGINNADIGIKAESRCFDAPARRLGCIIREQLTKFSTRLATKAFRWKSQSSADTIIGGERTDEGMKTTEEGPQTGAILSTQSQTTDCSASRHVDTDSECDSDEEHQAVCRQSSTTSTESMPTFNITRQYLGPPDFAERLSQPSARSGPITVWIPCDMYQIADTALRDLRAFLDDGVVLSTAHARLNSKGEVKVGAEAIAESDID